MSENVKLTANYNQISLWMYGLNEHEASKLKIEDRVALFNERHPELAPLTRDNYVDIINNHQDEMLAIECEKPVSKGYIFLWVKNKEDIEIEREKLRNGVSSGYVILPTSLWEDIDKGNRVFTGCAVQQELLTLK